MAHFLEADLQPWAAALAAVLFATNTAQHSTVPPQRKARRLASRDVSEAPPPSGSAAGAVVSSAARRESAWHCLEELRPLHGAADAVFHAAKLPPLLEQLPRTPAEWQPAVIGSRAVAGELVLSFREAAACCDVMHAVRGVHTLILQGGVTAQDATEVVATDRSASTAVASLSTLRTFKLTQDSGIGAAFPGPSLLLALTRLTQLVELELHWRDGDAAAVPRPPLRVLTTLTRLYLAIDVDGESACKLVSDVTCLSQLANFRFYGPVHDFEGQEVIAPALRHLSALTSLQLESSYYGSTDVEALAPALGRLSRLAELNLANNELEEAGATVLASPIAQLTALTALELGENAVRDAGAQALTPALRHLSRLAKLNLADNELEEDGAAFLASAIAQLTALTALELGENAVGDAGAEELAPALRHLSQLAYLCLADNRFGADGAFALAPVLGHLTALTQLDLSENDLGADGAEALAPALGHLSRLAALLLHSSKLGAAGAAALASPIALLHAVPHAVAASRPPPIATPLRASHRMF